MKTIFTSEKCISNIRSYSKKSPSGSGKVDTKSNETTTQMKIRKLLWLAVVADIGCESASAPSAMKINKTMSEKFTQPLSAVRSYFYLSAPSRSCRDNFLCLVNIAKRLVAAGGRDHGKNVP